VCQLVDANQMASFFETFFASALDRTLPGLRNNIANPVWVLYLCGINVCVQLPLEACIL
jgi:hypothetical protein